MGLNRIFLLLLGAGVAGVVLLACSHTSEPAHEPSLEKLTTSPAQKRAVQPVVDVPFLLTLTVDELPTRLGRPGRVPATFIDPSVVALNQIQSSIDSSTYFRYRGQEFVVSYNARTRRLNDVLLLGHNEDLLMQRGHLVPAAASYLLVPVFELRNATALQGLRVVPAHLDRL
ncbi:MAG: hypothetical protein M3Y54_12235 [Bacteroidota bacterium]|nr:hypothetical protein [Bacteroidota bacterium]